MAPSPLWDIVGKAANMVQLFGLDAVTLITIAMAFLQFHQVTKERWKLEARVLMLRVLVHSSSPAWWTIIQQQQHMELGDLVTKALEDAHDLVESYKESTLFTRVRRGRSMASQFCDLRYSIDCYYGLILFINAHLLIVQANPPAPSLVRTEVNGGGLSPPTEYSLDEETSRAAPHDTYIINIVTQ